MLNTTWKQPHFGENHTRAVIFFYSSMVFVTSKVVLFFYTDLICLEGVLCISVYNVQRFGCAQCSECVM